MFHLGRSDADQSGVPLSEHSGLMLATGLLYDDIDDQQDAIRGVLEIDPLLATWAVCCSFDSADVRLSSVQSACRWIANAWLDEIGDPTRLTFRQPTVAQRSVWQKIVVQAVATGRRAQQLLENKSGDSFVRAHWLGMLCSVKRQLEAFAELNGHSPLHGVTLVWPVWFQAMCRAIEDAGEDMHVDAEDATELVAVRDALVSMSEQPGAVDELVTQEERELWFRPYPEFRMLLPLLVGKSKRLVELEERFEETLSKEKMAALQQFAYGASHEINNPLANISTRAQTLVYNELDSERRKKLLAINDQAFRAYEMIADLMLFAKPPRMEILDTCVKTLLVGLREEIDSLARQRNVLVQVIVGEEAVRCRADPVQIALAIKAVCVNGIESMDGAGRLLIEVQNLARHVHIRIADEGTGLDESQRRHLFDPFYSGREAGRGFGFGLCKAWRIVEQHHGRIEINSQQPKGSVFTIVLPRAPFESTMNSSLPNSKEAVASEEA